MYLLDQMTPETVRSFATALQHRRARGDWPSTDELRRIAEEHGASVGALLVLTRYELLAADGSTVPLSGDRVFYPPAVVSDNDTVKAILMRGLPVARLKSSDGARIPNRVLSAWKDRW